MRTANHQNKVVDWNELGYPPFKSTCIHFTLKRYTFFVWFSQHEDIFSFKPLFKLHVLPLSQINVDCTFLASTLNRISALLEMLSQYIATVIMRSLFRTLLTMIELSTKTGSGFRVQHWLVFDSVLNSSLIMNQWLFLTKIPSKKCFSCTPQ